MFTCKMSKHLNTFQKFLLSQNGRLGFFFLNHGRLYPKLVLQPMLSTKDKLWKFMTPETEAFSLI